MKITILYDNEVTDSGLKPDRGFSCLIELPGTPKILFDTGASSSTLLHNMAYLELDPADIGIVVISHTHWDHSGGLQAIVNINPDAEYYLPQSFLMGIVAARVSKVGEPLEICPGVYSTGEIASVEQSLVITTEKGLVVVTGCSHPGVGRILDVASQYGTVHAIIGGFHGFRDFDKLKPLSLIYPCHCTIYKEEIKRLFKNTFRECKVGTVIEL